MDRECPICFNATDTALPCAHMLCHKCLQNLVASRNRKCPLCKYRLTSTSADVKRHISLLPSTS